MRLAVVRGQCTATVKDPSLGSRRFALVQTIDAEGNPDGPLEVALDVTSAAAGQTVLVTRGSAARIPESNRQVAADLAVVAIVDEVTLAPEKTSPAPRPRNSKRTGGK